jgi:hypothetical protein
MANTYKLNATQLNSTGSTTIYTVPSNVISSLVKSLYISNIATGSINIDVIINKSGSAINYWLIQSSSIPTQVTFQPISDTLVLQLGDSIKISNNTISGSNTLLSYMEIT